MGKTHLFDSMAADLAGCRPELHDHVLCPMCLKKIARADIGILAPEHIVQEALGGTITTLTCRETCNNNFGSKAESHLATLLNINEALRGRGDLGGSFEVAGHKVRVAARVLAAGLLGAATGGGKPATFEAIERAMEDKSQRWTLTLNLRYKPGRASAAVLRSAYLAAFHEYGYRYILSEAPDLIRREIPASMNGHSSRLCQITGTMPGVFEFNGNQPEALLIRLTLPSDREIVFVPLRLRANGRAYYMFSVLPSIGQNPRSVFEDLHAAMGVLGEHRLHMQGNEHGEIAIELALKN